MTLRIDLANIAGTPGARGSYPISEMAAPTEEYTPVGPVVGEVNVVNTGSLLLVRGRLHACVRVNCVRCLAECELPLEFSFLEEFATGETEADVPTMDREEPETAAMDHYVLDAGELVRQQLAVNVPMAQVCQETCAGLCPHCGQNLNEGPCGCPREPDNGPWSSLAGLLEQDDETT
jgi:uncharacterized protein